MEKRIPITDRPIDLNEIKKILEIENNIEGGAIDEISDDKIKIPPEVVINISDLMKAIKESTSKDDKK